MASSRSIGNVYAELSVKDKMTVGIKRASKAVSEFAAKIPGIGAGLAAALPAAAFTGIVASMKSAIDAGGQLADMMARTGASGEGLFVMQRAFENAGIAADAVPAALNRMQKALATGNEGFAKLGLNVSELMGMDATAAFRATAEAIAKIPDPAERAAAAMAIFGKSGGEMLAVMNDSSAFSQAAEQVGSLGKTLEQNAASFDKLGDAMGAIGVKMQQIGAEVAVELLPYLEDFADWLNRTDFSGATKDTIEFAKALGDAASNAASLVSELPGIKQASGMAGLLGKVPEWLAQFGPEQGKALPPANIYITKDGRAVDPMSEWNPGIMLKDLKTFTDVIPELLKRRPWMEYTEQPTLDQLGVPGLSSMMEAVASSLLVAGPPEQARRDTNWQQTQYEVNDMQRRGLGMGGENVVKEANKQTEYLKGIHEVLANAKLQDKELVWN